MKTTALHMGLALMMTASLTPVVADDSADNRRATVCERSADNMQRSCRFELDEQYYATLAKCINLPHAPARKQCEREAWLTKKEDRTLCRDQRAARKDLCELLGEDRFVEALDPDSFVADPDDANPYFSLAPGHTYVARAGEDFEEIIVVTVTDQLHEVLGVNCRRVVDVVLLQADDGYAAVEVTDDYYAQHTVTNDIHYCGETAQNFEDGLLVNIDGSFEAGRNQAVSGILIKGNPTTGDVHRQEYLLGEAEDAITYVNGADSPTAVSEGGENASFPCDGQCIKTLEFIPPQPAAGEHKYFIAGIGFVLGVALEDGEPTGERDEVMCVGDSLDVLTVTPEACGVAPGDLPDLLSELCRLAPDAFCD